MGPWWRSLLLWSFHTALIHGSILVGAQRPQESPPRPAGWSPAPSSSWAPTLEPRVSSADPEGSAVALGFLQTGDAQRLARANCSRSIVAGAAGAGPPPALRATLRAAPEALAHAANFLNMLFQTNDIREASVAEDVEWYQALVRSLVEGHPWVRRAVLALDAHPLAAKPRLMLQATKKDGEILLQDVSTAAPNLANLSWDNEWFNALKSQRTRLLRKRVLSNDLRSMETPKWQRGDSYVGDQGHVRWSLPFLECQDGRFLPTWTITLSSAFYGLKPDLSPEFKGVVRVDIDLRDAAIDQCASGPGWFADTHRCDLNSTQESHGFVLGRYLCQCKPGFYGVGGAASSAQAGAADGGSRLACRPCRPGCSTCEDDAPCLIQEDRALRAAVLSCQACCMLAVFLSMLVSYHFRRSKRIRASGVVLLETILFGSLLLYFPVFILYFKPSIFRCIVLRWVRMLGFAIVYGTITLKLYRVLKVFLSRTAQRVPYVSSGRVLKMLGLILLLVLWFLAAWTIGMLENIDKNIPLVIRTQTARGLHFYICGHDRWDYMMVIAEMLFLLWGSFLCYAMRAVPSAFHEPRYMGIALHNELMISAAFHVVRFIMVPSLHPDWTLLLFFAHTHGTITMTLALLFIPKFLHARSPLREEIAAEVYEDELDMRHSGSCLNSSIASAWSEHSLDPDDIREELKKLYTQLEVHKAWSMAANNPHLPRKRSSRRSLGRSIAHRIAELPEAVGRRSSRGERVGTPARRRSSAKGVPNAAGATSLRTRDDGTRRRAAAPHKSRSTEGPARASPDLGIAGDLAPEGKTPAATASEQSDSDSLDAAPLMCKSASAHNLAGHGQRPPAPLQKSLSITAGTQEEALLAASRAAQGKHHRNQTPTSEHPPGAHREAEKTQGPGDAHPPADSSPAERGSREDISPLGGGKVQKHVTYAPIKSVSVDGTHAPGRVRLAVRRTPPPPPVRCQSLGQRAMPPGDSPEPTETPEGPSKPPEDPMARVAEPEKPLEGPEEEDSAKGRVLGTAPFQAHVCPWELVQEEILSQRQKATKAADSESPGDAATKAPSLKPLPQKTSVRGLSLAIKAFNRSRGKSILKGKREREGEGSLRKRGQEREGGSRRERPNLAETDAASLGVMSPEPAANSPEGSRQRPSSEPTARRWQGDSVPCQHNNNAGSSGETAGWGDSGEQGEWDSPALGTGNGEKPAGAGLGPPSGVHEIQLSVGHREGAEHLHETPVVAGSEEGQRHPQQEAELRKDAPVGIVRLITPKEGMPGPAEGLEGGSRPFHRPPDHAEVEQPQAKPITGTSHPPTAPRAAAEEPRPEVGPQGAVGIPAGKGALLRQEAIASHEDIRVSPGEGSPAKALEKGSSQPEPFGDGGSRGAQRVPPRSWSVDAAPVALGGQAKVCAGEIQADSSLKPEICLGEESGGESWGPGMGSSEGDPGEEQGMEKPPAEPPELPKPAGSAEGRRAEVCPWESGEGERMERAEICPWGAEGARPEQETREGERRWLGKRGRSIRPQSLGLLGAQESGSSLKAPKGSSSSSEPAPKPAPKSPGLPEVTWKSPASTRASVRPWEAEGDAAGVYPWKKGTASFDGRKLGDGEIPQVENGISQQRAAARGLGETAPPAGKESGQWGSPQPGEGVEQLGTALPAKHPALPKAAFKPAGAIDSKKANVCPWEVEEELPAATEICLWEEPGAPSGKETPSQGTRGTPKGEGLEGIKAKLADMGTSGPEHRDSRVFAKLDMKRPEGSKAESKKTQSMESIKEEVCPWESLDTEQHPEHPRAMSLVLPNSPSSKSQSVESLKAEVCPWEAQEVECIDKEEICPWEVAAAPSIKGKSSQDKAGLSIGSRSSSTDQDLSKEIGESRAGKKEEASRDHPSVCPSESPDTEKHQEKPHAGSPVLTESPSEKSQSMENDKEEVSPWETSELESTDKAEICPWEEALPPSGKKKSRQDKEGLSIGSRSSSTGQDLGKETGESLAGKKESSSRNRELICPWESLDTEQHPEKPRAGSPALPKSPSSKSQSVESLKAEVCPWKALEVESIDKAEICLWEVAAAPLSKGKSSQDKAGLSRGSKSPSPGRGIHKEIGQSRAGKKEEASTDRESIWESLDTEQPPEHPRARSPALPKSPSKKSQSTESWKAEVCPWEAQELGSMDKAEICPWEVAAAPSDRPKAKQGPGDAPKAEKRITRQAALGSPARSLEKGSSEREAVCPWKSPGTEQHLEKPRAGSPALPKSPSSKSQSVESWKTEVCPWEVESTDKGEICPWEEAAPPSGKEKSRQDKDGLSIGSRSPSTGQDLGKETGESPAGKKEEASRNRELICPWESLDTEQHLEKPSAGSPALPKSPSSKSQSVESLKAEVCPWKAPEVESIDEPEFCLWEVAAAALSKGKPSQDKAGLSRGSKSPSPGRGIHKEIGQSRAGKKEEASTDRESIWESLDTEQPPEHPRARSPALPKSPSKKSQSTESWKAEVCPWEAQELGSMDKAEICPWEVAAAPSDRPKAKQGPGDAPKAEKRITRQAALGSPARSLEKGSSEREAVCPWESPGTEQHPEKPHIRSPALPKSPSSKSQSVESLKAEVCPWEALEVESINKAEICPWETDSPQSGKEKRREDKAGLSLGSRSPSPGRGIHKEIGESKAGKKEEASRDRESICPWETMDTEVSSPGHRTRSTEILKDTARKVATMESVKAEICPWESPGMKQPPEKTRAGSPALPKSPSSKSQSVESLRTEVCPWEVESMDEAEICPWEAAAPPPGKQKPREDKDGLSIGSRSPSTGRGIHKEIGDSKAGKKQQVSRDRESICPWESLDTEQHLEKPRAGSPALPKSPSSKTQSVESLKAEVCPWEAPEVESINKAEICPWETDSPQSGKEKCRGDKAGLSLGSRSPSPGQGIHKEIGESKAGKKEEASRDRESICPWETMDTEVSSPGHRMRSTEILKDTARKVATMESVKAEICPWESPGTKLPPEKPHAGSPALPKSPSEKSQSVESWKAEVCPWEAPELRSTDKAEICPWEAAAPPPGKQKPREDKDGMSIGSRSLSTGQDLSKNIRESRAGKKKEASTDRESICPWETMDTEHHPEKPRAGSPALPKSPSSKSQSVESQKAEVCPWEVESMDKAEICPWEVAAAPSDRPKAKQGPGDAPKAEKRITRQAALGSPARSLEKGSSEREAVCPWESPGTEQHLEKPHVRSPALPKSPSSKSQSVESLKAEVCPWEVESTDKAEICPWEAAAPPSAKQKAREDREDWSIGSKNLSTGQDLSKDIGESRAGKKKEASRDRESICPWETMDTEKHLEKPRAGSPALPKSPSSKSQSVESLKVEVCPWEAPEVESINKAEICPWETDSPQSGKEKRREDKAGLSLGSRSPSPGQGMHKEIGESKAGKKEEASRDRESICPWETMDTEVSSPGHRMRSTEILKDTARKVATMESVKAEICPWESPGTKQPPEKPHAGSPALPKSPSEKSQSVESWKAEVCPWEAPELRSTDKAEICPWEAAAPPSAKQKPREDREGLSIGSRSPSIRQDLSKDIGESRAGKKKEASTDRESICPWETMDTEHHPEKPRAGSPALPKSPSSKSQSVESLKAEVCPWEVESTDKAEICPWEAAAPPSAKQKAREDKDGLSIGSRSPSTGRGIHKEIGGSRSGKRDEARRDRESICPWESLDTEQPPANPRAGSPALPKSPSEKSQSVESLKAEICPWEALELGATDKAEICPWESLGTEQPSLKCGMGKEPAKKSANMESRKSDLCPWEAAEPSGLEKESFKPAMHPQGADGASPAVTGQSKLAARARSVSPILMEKSKSRSEAKGEHKPLRRIAPGIQPPRGLGAEPRPGGAGSSPGGTELCPWEAEAPPRISKTSAEPGNISEVCLWEVGSAEPTASLRKQGRARVSPADGGTGMGETSPDVCPWDYE